MQKLTSCEIINENFFFIDSNNLDQVQSKMYGYYIDGDQIIDSKNESNFTKDYSDILDGSFILIQRAGDQIVVALKKFFSSKVEIILRFLTHLSCLSIRSKQNFLLLSMKIMLITLSERNQSLFVQIL